MRRYSTEFIGTFFLTFVVVTTSLVAAPLAPVAIGVVLAAMVFAGGHLSDAHYNPAVTLAVWVRGRIAQRDAVGYVAAQVLGAAVAAWTAVVVAGRRPASALDLTGAAQGRALLAEVLITFALAYVVLNVATSSAHAQNSFYGLAIGFTVMSGAVAVGGISGGAFNLAVGAALCVSGLVSWSVLWIYLVANLAGGALAGLTFRLLNPGEYRMPPAFADALTPSGGSDVPAPRPRPDDAAVPR